jgi:hypothetical protein
VLHQLLNPLAPGRELLLRLNADSRQEPSAELVGYRVAARRIQLNNIRRIQFTDVCDVATGKRVALSSCSVQVLPARS